jgi:quercetin dioxygenase-like cupin family protein
MIVIDSGNVEAEETRDEIVAKGEVHRKALIDSGDTGGFGILLVTFSPGARLNFHTHTYEQILYVTEGKGVVATHDEEKIVTPGTVIYIEPGEAHWHGATDDSPFAHIAIQKPGIKLAQ